ncbi:hypothetical protein H310_11341 [Aphanomyces invadans]|uniref:Uncharacterized protein n=1 Tax=Aphanomyces invadans TaxID=157072 RepID=A0A024TM23_9STRA|nr:hypothetical protein H310_11341 [Aphanomyces invadans]ETV95039.1 hypothetical protein H310_11341 [Aphanomyces invadans]|eukprot:XP_008876212.1 hypothetical protein H310_11341 [Aphanomyces invadans]
MGCHHSTAVPAFTAMPGTADLKHDQRRRMPSLQPTFSTTSDVSVKHLSMPHKRVQPLLAQVKYPCHTSTWIRGNPVAVEWTVLDMSAVYVMIELCQVGSTATTLLTASAPNTGCFVYSKVPWGLIGEGFYIRIVELIPGQGCGTPREALSELFRVGNSRWPDTSSEGSLTPLSVRASSMRSPSPMSSRWQAEHTPVSHHRPVTSCY